MPYTNSTRKNELQNGGGVIDAKSLYHHGPKLFYLKKKKFARNFGIFFIFGAWIQHKKRSK